MNNESRKPREVRVDDSHHSFMGATWVISACTMFSRVLGLVRDVLWARYVGSGLISSAFVTAWTVPNAFRAIFGEGAANSAMVPTFTESQTKGDPEDTRRLYSVTFTVMLLVLGAVTILIELALAALGHAADFEQKTQLLIRYMAVLMPYMLLICLAGFFMAALNARRRFFAPAFMPALLNIVWIAGVLVFARGAKGPEGLEQAVLYIALSTLLAGILQVLFQVPFARRAGMRLGFSLDLSHPGFRQILRLLAPVVIGSAAIEVNVLVNRTLAFYAVSYDGAPTCLFFADRIVQIPMAMIGLAISTAVLTPLSEHAAVHDMERFRRTLASALRLTLFLTVPAAAGLMALAPSIIDVFFQHGRFAADVQAAPRTAWVVFFYCLGLWAQTGVFVLLRGFYALKDTRTPPRVAVLNVLFNIALNLTFVWFLEERGLALGTAISAMAQFTALFLILRRRLGRLDGRNILLTTLKTGVISMVMGAAAAAACHWWWPSAGGWERPLMLAGMLVLSAGIFACGARLLRMPELKQVLHVRRPTTERPKA